MWWWSSGSTKPPPSPAESLAEFPSQPRWFNESPSASACDSEPPVYWEQRGSKIGCRPRYHPPLPFKVRDSCALHTTPEKMTAYLAMFHTGTSMIHECTLLVLLAPLGSLVSWCHSYLLGLSSWLIVMLVFLRLVVHMVVLFSHLWDFLYISKLQTFVYHSQRYISSARRILQHLVKRWILLNPKYRLATYSPVQMNSRLLLALYIRIVSQWHGNNRFYWLECRPASRVMEQEFQFYFFHMEF